MLEALWWGAFLLAGIWGQRFVPGVDFLAPCLVFCQQEHSPGRTLLFALGLILVQEGIGSQGFGTMLLWYGLMGLMYSLGRWIFQPRSLLFILLLGLALGGLHMVVVWISATLAVQPLVPGRLAGEGLLQWLVFVAAWWLMDRSFPKDWRSDEQPV